MPSTLTLGVLVAALVIDRIAGDPDWLWRRIRHPVALCGHFVDFLDRTLNSEQPGSTSAQRRGLATAAILVVVAAISGTVLHLLFRSIPFGWIIEALPVAILIAQKSLLDHLRAVSLALRNGGIEAGRDAVGKIVGRNTGGMDETDVSRAAIESAAENFSDGVVAPAFWYLFFGLPGLFVYKAVNTADSMIGHKTDRYIQFGFGVARLDDLLNFIPARISGGLIAITAPWFGGMTGKALSIMRSDARGHASPNAGWPEAAMAGTLDVALGGPRRYGDTIVEGVWINAEGNRALQSTDIDRSVRLVDVAWLHVTAVLAVILILAVMI